MKKNNYDALLRPYWYAAPSFQVIIMGTLFALAPQIFMLFVTKSYSALGNILSAVCASLFAEGINKLLRNTGGFQGMYAGLQGLITGMFFPGEYPILSVFALTLCTMLLAKYAFGGPAASWINQAALTVALAYVVGSRWFPDFLILKSQLALENPVARLFMNTQISSLDIRVTGFLNSTVFGFTGALIPAGFFSFFWDSGAAIPVFRFNVLTLAASIALIVFDIIYWVIPACFLGVYFLLVLFFAPLAGGGIFAFGDVLLAALTGGTLFTAFFMLQWFGTVPQSIKGKIVYGCIAGGFGFIFCGCGASPAGAVFTVLAANLASTFIQFYEQYHRRGDFRNKLLPRIIDFWRLSHGGN
ncbi:MAG: RnfABCDGE type electron transport complex subunit D [Treponema sp.]|nr:RnfABCDGE type electron transport complex subunit D [Treponema sp.]